MGTRAIAGFTRDGLRWFGTLVFCGEVFDFIWRDHRKFMTRKTPNSLPTHTQPLSPSRRRFRVDN